jgi:DNA-binding response OmpR family regulator
MTKRALFINSIDAYPAIPEYLAAAGYRVDTSGDLDTGLHLMAGWQYDIIIVRDEAGAESWRLCERIRALTTAPLIVINNRASTETCVRAIDAGADFFMRKPFGASELLARVRCLLQRNSPYQPALATA